MSKQLSFVADKEALELIEKLKKELGVKTTAGVFRKALTLADIAADQAKSTNHVVSINGRDADPSQAVNVILRG